jgi:hypothetical protein
VHRLDFSHFLQAANAFTASGHPTAADAGFICHKKANFVLNGKISGQQVNGNSASFTQPQESPISLTDQIESQKPLRIADSTAITVCLGTLE